jgi:hypothetical protein
VTGIARLRARLAVRPGTLALYLALYLPVGFFMNWLGQQAQIAEFRNWWQVLTCYGLYLIPWSLWVRDRTPFEQYLYGLLALGLLEILGYATGSSIAHEGNILDRTLGPRNFTLAMTMWFAAYLPLGNLAVSRIEAWLPDRRS